MAGAVVRFVIHESEGWFSLPSGGTVRSRPTGITVTVHDTFYLHEVVGLFRSENVTVPGYSGRRAPNAARKMWVRRQGRRLAERLNDG